jgi:WD40 repeat protein
MPPPAFSPDGRWAAAGDGAGVLRVWDVATGAVAHEEHLHGDAVNRLAWSPDGQFIATASEDKHAIVFSVGAGRFADLSHAAAVEDVAFSPDGYLVATASDDNRASVWSFTGELRYRLDGHRSQVWGVVFSPDGDTVATVSLDGTARLWWTDTGRERLQLTHPARIDQIAVSGSTVLIKGDRHLTVWDLVSGRRISSKTTPRSFARMSFSEHSGLAAAADRNEVLHMLDTTSLAERCASERGNPSRIHRIALSADGSILLVAGAELPGAPYNNVLQLWDAQRCTFVQTLAQLKYDAAGLLFAPGGSSFALWTQGAFLLYGSNPRAALQFPVLQRHQTITRSAFSANGERLITAFDGGVLVWEAATGKQLASIAGQTTRANPVTFAAAATSFVTVEEFGRIEILAEPSWNAVSVTSEPEYPAHIAISPSARFFATSRGSVTKVWNAQTGELHHELLGENAVFVGNDSSVLTFEDDKAIVYDLTVDALMSAAMRRLPAERKNDPREN